MKKEKQGAKSPLSAEDLEKSWNDSKSLLKSLMDDDDSTDESDNGSEDDSLEKAKGEQSALNLGKDEEDDDENEEEEEEEEEEDEDDESKSKSKMKKSLEDDMSSDEATQKAMDVEPFLRKLVKAISNRFDSIESNNKKITKALVKSLLVVGDQNAMIAETVEAIAETPVGSKSVIRKSLEKYNNAIEKEKNPEKAKRLELFKSMDKNTILEKAINLSKSGVLTSRDVAKINTRIQKNIELDDDYISILVKEEK